MSRQTTTRRRSGARLLVVAAVALLLAGCIKFDTDLTVSSDDTVSGEIILGFDRALLEMGGGSLDDLMGEDLAPVPSDVEGVTVEEWEDEDFIGQRFVVEAVPLEEFNNNGEAGALRIERDGDVFRMSGNMDMGSTEDLAGSEDLGIDPSLFLGDAELEVSVTFPGEVLETNGEVEGTTVTWEPSLTGANEFMAVANAEPGGANNLLWILLAVVLLLVLAAVAFLLMRRRSQPATADGAPVDGADASGWPTTAPPPATSSGQAPPPTTGTGPSSAPPPPPPPPSTSSSDDTVEIPGARDDTTPMPPPPPPA
ncbi:LppM family (lipo)protein [Salsipaludibacter albus]|uniref:LppM family (lipo)protein n=1 Tax=Salsipaludibacter albus TaxID=2849650 RepID=UPI001EE43A50|nr:hypothetical protein [Salsipaludibacter albus]MBY5163431.1 hypothetical protein [Salsipaludibacter albus]